MVALFPSVADLHSVAFVSWLWLTTVTAFHLVCFFLVCWHCLHSRREPNSTLLWIFLSWAFPAVGPLLYLTIGVDRVPYKAFRKHVTNQKIFEERQAMEEGGPQAVYWHAVHDSVADTPLTGLAGDLDRAMNAIVPTHAVLKGNSITPLVTGEQAFPEMFDAIRGAKHHVHLQSFIIGNDRVGRDMLDLLADKAREGVRVRVLYDRFGSSLALLSGLFRRYRHIPNMDVVGWTQATPLKRQFQVNLRNHRKVLIVDGTLAFCGGINIQANNITRKKTPPIRDYHFAVSGPIVQELQYTFVRDWYFITDEEPAALLNEYCFPRFTPRGDALMRLMNGGPSTPNETLADVYFMAIVSARKQILIATPYFVPAPDIVRAMRSAALRGVDVRLIVPWRNNHFYAGYAGRALYEELLDSGVRVFERRGPFMHAKAFIADDSIAIVGTANLDVRSLRLNYETNLAVYDERFINKMKAIVLEDESQSTEIDPAAWRSRPTHQRVLENTAYLMMPVL